MRAVAGSRRRPAFGVDAAWRRKFDARCLADVALSDTLAIAEYEEVLKVARLHLNFLQACRNIAVFVVDRSTQVIVPGLKLYLQMRSRWANPFVFLPFPFATHRLRRDQVFMRAHGREVSAFGAVRPRPIGKTTGLQNQVLHVGVFVEHFHRFDGKRTAQMDSKHDERSVPT